MNSDWKSYPKILMAAWPDGRVVWPRDKQKGGPPFLESFVNPAIMESALSKFRKDGVFEKDSFRHSWVGPDSTYHSIWLSHGGKHTRVESWHELYEVNPDVIVVNGGITILEGRKREDVIASDTKEFQAFRKLWSELRAMIDELTPKRGTPRADNLNLELPE